MADISYTPTTWADGSEGGTPIDAAKLNNIESGISDAVAAIGPNDTTADGTLKAQIDALGESVSFNRYIDKQTTGGVIAIPDSKMKYNSTVLVNGIYVSGRGQMNYFFSAQADTNQLIVYVRKADGSIPPDGTVVCFSAYVKY